MTEIIRGQSATLKDLAQDFAVSERIFRDWMKKAGISKGSSHYLKPITIRKIYNTFGTPMVEQRRNVA